MVWVGAKNGVFLLINMTPYMDSLDNISDLYRVWSRNLQESQQRRMELQTNLESQQRQQRLSRAVWLQARWQEVSERERRAHLHNRQLLLDFQRAQDTLNNLVARTEAMNTIRVEYEKYLEDSFPHWQQKLEEKRLEAQRKRVELHLNDCIKRMEKDSRTERDDIRHTAETQPSSSTSSSHPSVPYLSSHSNRRGDGHPRMSRNSALTQHDSKQNTQRHNIQHDYHPHGVHQPLSTGLINTQPHVSNTQHSGISKDTRSFQSSYGPLNPPLLPYYPPISNTLCDPYSMVHGNPSDVDHFRSYPYAWAGVGRGFTPTAQSTPAQVPGTGFSMINPLIQETIPVTEPNNEIFQSGEVEEEQGEGTESSNTEEENSKGKEHKKNRRSRDQSYELDTKPVRLSMDCEDSSERSSCDVVMKQSKGSQRTRTERRTGVQDHSPMDTEESVSHCSSMLSQTVSAANSGAQAQSLSVSDSQSKTRRKKSKKSQKSLLKKITHRNNTTNRTSPVKITTAAEITSSKLQEERDKPEESKSFEVISTEEEKSMKEAERSGTDDLEEEEVVEESSCSSGGGGRDEQGREEESNEENEEEETGSDEEHQDEEKGNEKVMERRDEMEKSDREMKDNKGDKERDHINNHTSEEESRQVTPSEESDSEKKRDIEEGEEETDGELEQDRSAGSLKKRDKEKALRRKAHGMVGEQAGDDSEVEGDDNKVGKTTEQQDSTEDEHDAAPEIDRDEEGIKEESLYDRKSKDNMDDNDDDEEEGEEEEDDDDDDDDAEDDDNDKDDAEDNDNDNVEEGKEEEDDDDDDDVIVDKGYPCSTTPYNHSKYQHDDDDDDDDDIESLVAPQEHSLNQQADKLEVTVEPKDFRNDTDERDLYAKAPATAPKEDLDNSDDEFDHFYD